MTQEIPFEPFPFIGDPHKQTIISSLFNILSEPTSKQEIVPLSDGDKLSLEITTPDDWKPTDLTVMMIHGLCGSHQSPYLVRLTKRLQPKGVRSIRLNLRGCGSGKGLAKYMYHSGRSEDVFMAIQHIKAETPDSPMILIGFSLGGNIVLKLAGELGNLAKEFLIGVLAISPPVDLLSSVTMIGHPDNAIYEHYFMGLMRENVLYRHQKFKDLPRVELPSDLKFYEFDQIYTARYYNFKDARDYYQKCSSMQLVPEISIPCKILLAEDDPIVSSVSLDHFTLPDHVHLFKTKHGGHMGYLANPTVGKGLYWLDTLLMDWILGF